jgi:hypothetical protein
MNSIPTFTESLICQKSNGVDAASIVAGQAPQTSKISSTARIGEILLSWYCATKDNQLTIYGKRTTGIRPILVHSNLDIE